MAATGTRTFPSRRSGRTSAQPLKSQGWTQPQSNYSGQVDWTVDNTSLISVRGGRFWDNFRTWGIPANSSVTYQASGVGVPGLAPQLQQPQGYFNTPRTQQTFFDITARTYVPRRCIPWWNGMSGRCGR